MNEKGELIKSFKTSKTGKLKLVKRGDHFQTTDIYSNNHQDELVTVFEDGAIIKTHTFEEVKARTTTKAFEIA